MAVVYEKHPVSPERKAELIAQGHSIIDLKFKPKDAVEEVVAEEPAEEPKVEEKPSKKRSKKDG